MNTFSIEINSFLFELTTGTMSKKCFLSHNRDIFPNPEDMSDFVSVQTHTLKTYCTHWWVDEAGLEPSDAQVLPCVVPLLYMCSCRFGGLLVYINSVTNYIDSTQICVSPKGNVLVHKFGHRDRNRTQWYNISMAGCVPPIYIMCSYALEGVLVYLNSVRYYVDSSTQIWVPLRKYLFSIYN